MSNREVTRVGIILADLGKLNISALKYLVLQMNTHLRSIQFEFITSDTDFFETLTSESSVDWDAGEIFKKLKKFREEVISNRISYGLGGELPEKVVIISLCKFSDGFYMRSFENLTVCALGGWEKEMAPPSILEFITTLLTAIALDCASPSFGTAGSHYETKGCLGDFTAYLSDVRYMALTGFICAQCRAQLRQDGLEHLADEVQPILNRSWLGDRSIATSPAAITSKLGFDLFTTRGLTPSASERLTQILEEEGVKQAVGIVAAVGIAALLVWLGLKDH